MILDMLKRSGRKIRFRSEPATQNNVHDRLSSGCKIFHFTGHGYANSLEFENQERCGEAESLEVPYFLFAMHGTCLCHVAGNVSTPPATTHGGCLPNVPCSLFPVR